MAIVVSNVGEAFLLEAAVGKTAVGTGLKLHLYSNNYTPVHTSVVGDFTEATFTGSTAKSLANASWSAAVAGTGTGTGTSNKASISYGSAQTFTATAAFQTIYGYYVTDNGNTVLLWAELFASPKVLAVNGDSITITPAITLSTE